MYTQVRKQGEIVELVIGLGLLDWPKPINVHRHIVSARVDLNFDLSTGTIRVESASDGAQLRIEDDMLDAELRPERGIYASIDEQLNAIGDEIWDHQRMQSVLKSWAIALHADIQWSDTLKPTPDAQGRPTVTLAPALILRKRTQIGMVRIYDCLIQRLSAQHDDVPRG